MNDAPRLALDCLQIGCKIMARDVGVLAVGTVVEKLADGHTLHQLRHSAYVVGVVVSNEHMVDARDSGVFHRCLDAFGITAVVIGPAGIDEHRCTGRRNKQRGLAAFNVDRIDEEVLWRLACAWAGCGAAKNRSQRERGRRSAGKGEQAVRQGRPKVESGVERRFAFAESVTAHAAIRKQDCRVQGSTILPQVCCW